MKIIVTIYNTPSSGQSPFVRQFEPTETGLKSACWYMMDFRRSRIATTDHMTLMDQEGLHVYSGECGYRFTVPPAQCIQLNLAHWRKCLNLQPSLLLGLEDESQRGVLAV